MRGGIGVLIQRYSCGDLNDIINEEKVSIRQKYGVDGSSNLILAVGRLAARRVWFVIEGLR